MQILPLLQLALVTFRPTLPYSKNIIISDFLKRDILGAFGFFPLNPHQGSALDPLEGLQCPLDPSCILVRCGRTTVKLLPTPMSSIGWKSIPVYKKLRVGKFFTEFCLTYCNDFNFKLSPLRDFNSVKSISLIVINSVIFLSYLLITRRLHSILISDCSIVAPVFIHY